jgi:FG-GAP-like repeat
MSRQKARLKKKFIAPVRRKRGRCKLAIVISVLLVLAVAGVILARWRTLSAPSSPTALMPEPVVSSSPTLNPFAPKRAAKEYIYVGGKMQAIEEAKPPAGGTSFDFSGDGSGEVVVWRPSEGNWYVLNIATDPATSTLHQLGQSGDIIVPGDYDGDSKTDIAVWHPKNGTDCNGCGWYVKQSSTNTVAYTADWGDNNDVTVPADYDGDGKTDKAVWRPSEGQWYIRQSSNNANRIVGWGQAGDRIVPADYDGDGRVDIAVWRPSEGNWYIKKSSDGTTLPPRGWGQQGDKPVPAAYVRCPAPTPENWCE